MCIYVYIYIHIYVYTYTYVSACISSRTSQTPPRDEYILIYILIYVLCTACGSCSACTMFHPVSYISKHLEKKFKKK